MIRLLLFFLFWFAWTTLISQKEDNIWVGGYSSNGVLNDSVWGHTLIDFNVDPVAIYKSQFQYPTLSGVSGTICDADGQLQLISNGFVLMDGQGKMIEDTINYDGNSICWEWNYNNSIGQAGHDRMLMLPLDDSIVTLYNSSNRCDGSCINDSRIKTMHISKQNGRILKDEKVWFVDSLNWAMYSVRHGNGRDWWIVLNSDNATMLNVFLLDHKGLHLVNRWPTGAGIVGDCRPHTSASFSPDGTKLALMIEYAPSQVYGTDLVVYDFDRCDGTLSNRRLEPLPNDGGNNGIEFSYDSRYLYVVGYEEIIQFEPDYPDMSMTRASIAMYDGFTHQIPGFPSVEWHSDFGYLKLGGDGKIYIFPATSNRYIGSISHPEEFWTNVDLKQHHIRMPSIITHLKPNGANFRLGPLDGSSCDTLGLDNHPIAKYRYEPDTIDYKRIRFTDLSYFRPETWSWDFGDGSPKISIKSPYHTFPKDGTYKVCLTVSNENSSNTSCRNITIGVSSTDDDQQNPIDVNIFPNPVQDVLLVTIGEYVPAQAYIEFYSALGQQVHRQRVFYGHNNVDMTALPAGVYAWRIVDRGVLVKSGEVVKM